MKNNRSPTRRMSPVSAILLLLLILVVGGGGTIAALYGLGIVNLPFLHHEISHAGMIAVPMSGERIPAYTRINRDHLANPKTHELNVLWIPKRSRSPQMLTDLSKIIGRVMDHDKPAGYAFTESDFLPVGTRAGPAAGIPAGKRSLTLDVTHLSGVFDLQAGDHIDLLATVPIEPLKGGGARSNPTSGVLVAQQRMASMQKRASVRPLAEDAVVVEPVKTRQKPISSSSLTQGTTTRTVPVQEIVIAVDPAEVAPVTEAVAMHVDIMCVARSGLPNDPAAKRLTPGSDPLSQVKVIDAISGKHREALVFSSDGNPEPQPDAIAPAASPSAATGVAGQPQPLIPPPSAPPRAAGKRHVGARHAVSN